ncbi:MAG: glucokinase [Paracoccaceae bacterium]
MFLVADIGGTNTRLALADGTAPLPDTIRSYLNDDFDGFDGALSAFLSEMDHPDVTAICVAIAGPVQGEHGTLTNRDWGVHTGQLRHLSGAGTAVLMNDLAALGYAIPHLGNDQVETLRDAQPGARRNGQSFVLGLGTGVNLAVSMSIGKGTYRVLEAEAGHAGLPAGIMDRLIDAIGAQAATQFPSVEELFAGRGLSALHASLTGGPVVPGRDIIDGKDETSQRAVSLFASLAGDMLRDLILLYLPLDGIYLNGGVFRGVLSAGKTPFLEALAAPHMLSEIIDAPSIRLITDDAAALRGCAARLAQEV